MKKILLCFAAVAAVCMLGCQHPTTDGKCHIRGTVNGPEYEGKRIFLVPLTGPATAETVDSMEIKGGKFEFSPDTMQMYKILLDYHYRYGTQPLLVVAEPGNINVVIDSISHATGTPQNDSLEKWKEATEKHNSEYVMLYRAQKKAQADSVHARYKQFTRRMAANMKEGTLHDFLNGLYPLTYKKKLPDGRVVTMNADTNEEVK